MANSRYIKGQQTGSLPEYLQKELRALEMMFLPLKWIDVTFQNGWANFGAGFQTAQYCTDPTGSQVHIRGLVKSGTMGLSIFTLPAPFRPLSRLLFAQCSNNALGTLEQYQRVDVQADGQVIPFVSGTSSNLFVSVNMSFFIGG